MNFRSWCSGIGAPEQAWTPLGWRCLSTSEIDPQASAVLAHRHGAPNLGDMTDPAVKDRITHERAELFVAGTPCQSFSVAGLRKGMADPRGNLALVFLGLVDAARPEWVVWENVPGVLSSSGGRDFGAFLGALGQLGYGWAYRILDAQYVRVHSHARAVPQRRRRVFVVGYLGDLRRAAAVLFERGSLCGHSAPRRTAWEGLAGALGGGASRRGWCDDTDRSTFVPVVSPAMKSRDAKGPSSDGDGDGLPLVVGALSPGAHPGSYNGQDAYTNHLVAHTLKAEGHDASEDGTGRGVPLVTSVCMGSDPIHSEEVAMPQTRRNGDPGVVCFQTRIARNGRGQPRDTTDALTSCAANTHADSKPNVAYSGCVRRLMPIECERLQGFPDHYTQVPWKGKPMADAPRYRMLGNSMAVNVMSWIGQRIEAVERIGKEQPK